jgi:hypothetical protein
VPLLPGADAIWLAGFFLLGGLPFVSFAYYRMRTTGIEKKLAIQHMISQLDRLEDPNRWFNTTGVALHDTTPKDFYWQLVRMLASARQLLIVINRACISQKRLVTIHRAARSDYLPGLQFVVKSLVDAGAHLEWGREGPWLIGANFSSVSSTEFKAEFGRLLSETGHHEVARQIGHYRFESAIRITNDEENVGMFALLENEYLGVYYHRSRNHWHHRGAGTQRGRGRKSKGVGSRFSGDGTSC